jgi:hypothetical protein
MIYGCWLWKHILGKCAMVSNRFFMAAKSNLTLPWSGMHRLGKVR